MIKYLTTNRILFLKFSQDSRKQSPGRIGWSFSRSLEVVQCSKFRDSLPHWGCNLQHLWSKVPRVWSPATMSRCLCCEKNFDSNCWTRNFNAGKIINQYKVRAIILNFTLILMFNIINSSFVLEMVFTQGICQTKN